MRYRSLYKSYILAKEGKISISDVISQLDRFKSTRLLGVNEAEIGICIFDGFYDYVKRVHSLLATINMSHTGTKMVLENAVSHVLASGISLSYDELSRAVQSRPQDKSQIAGVNMVNAFKYCQSNSLSEKSICDLCGIISNGCCIGVRKQRTLYRETQLNVVKNRKTLYQAEIPEFVQYDVQNMIRYVSEDSSYGILKAVIAHQYFRYISPMKYDNDRLARMVMLMCLNEAGYVGALHYPIAQEIVKSLEGYYASFEDSVLPVIYKGMWLIDITPAVLYMLAMFERCAYSFHVPNLGVEGSENIIVGSLKTRSYMSCKDCSNLLNCDISKARNILNGMVLKGLLIKYKKGNMNLYSLLR